MTDRDAVREAAIMTIAASHPPEWRRRLATALGVHPESPADTIADALLGLAQQGEAEPVAWGIWHSNGDLVGLKHTKEEAERWCGGSATYGPPRPLYTRPVAATEEMVGAGLKAWCDHIEEVDKTLPPRPEPWHRKAMEDGLRGNVRRILTAALSAGPNPKEK